MKWLLPPTLMASSRSEESIQCKNRGTLNRIQFGSVEMKRKAVWVTLVISAIQVI